MFTGIRRRGSLHSGAGRQRLPRRTRKGEVLMDDGFSFFCGSVPILLLLWRHGGGPRPGALFLLLAGCIGGLVSYMVFGPELAKEGGALQILALAIPGG